jgi:hypothetical protein
VREVKIVIHSVSDRGKHPLAYGLFTCRHDATAYVLLWAGLSRQTGVAIDITIEGHNNAQELGTDDTRGAVGAIDGGVCGG